jgi:hypothetical protein
MRIVYPGCIQNRGAMRFLVFREASAESVDHSWNWLCKVGGISFLVTGIWYVFASYWGFIAGVPALALQHRL